MKKVLTILFILLLSQFTFAQNQNEAYKLAEYEATGAGCDEYFRMIDFAQKLDEQKNSKGLVVIYSGSGNKRGGNLLAYISGAKKYLVNNLGLSSDKVSFIVGEGKSLFSEEFWIIPDNAKLPPIETAKFNWDNLTSKYHFSQTCLICEPSYPLLTTFQGGYKDFAKILIENSKYKGLILVNSLSDSKIIKWELTKKHYLPLNRYAIQIAKKKNNDESFAVDLYIVPAKAK